MAGLRPALWPIQKVLGSAPWVLRKINAFAAQRARETQYPVEVLVKPDTAKGRLTQYPVEAVILPTGAKARMTQMPVEVLVQNVLAKGRLTQYPVEVLVRHLRESVDVYVTD